MTHRAAPLEGRCAVVTGAARGIGRAIAASLTDAGARVAIVDLDEERGSAVADAIGAVFLRADLGDDAQARAAVASAAEALGGLDVLVNNAGVFRCGPLLEITAGEWDDVQRLNTRSMLSTTQAAAPYLIAAGGGSIVNLASMAAKDGGAMEAAYAASKAAVVALTRATAQELGVHGVRANALCPGYVLTEMGAATRTAEDVARWTARSPLGRLAAPEDVASLATFLAGPSSSYLTGQAFNVTGGMITH
ncbi:SDR family NAD(P)-dependent oxidoreductase [Demequina mangrovi]|uniref:3-oxoacyl-[acyl-carrier protein] reductase n=1 Tax=Demequina mangrovi TaxID=1043493 RepID=A0A1H7A256_9MICO|nr:SDR family NAD(P)-dependent oxidoreductase [Demequina mangrovi]SEJ59681.1 3-oxoacyl-[acyl-carrier protein] reductase [Demequina mangrovi]